MVSSWVSPYDVRLAVRGVFRDLADIVLIFGPLERGESEAGRADWLPATRMEFSPFAEVRMGEG